MHRRWYFEMCKTQNNEWLMAQAFSPAKGMTKLDVATIKLVLRYRLKKHKRLRHRW